MVIIVKRKNYFILLLIIAVIGAYFLTSNLSKSNQVVPWTIEYLNVDSLDEFNGNNIKVAILDTGIDISHPDLKGKVVKEYNTISPGNPSIDESGHGTAVAGIIAAIDNNIGTKGINPQVNLYSVKVVDENGRGKLEDLIEGIEWCIDQNVDIINISLGRSHGNKSLEAVVEKAIENGIVIVASSGNNFNEDSDYPAAYKNVISVTTVDEKNILPSFVSKGKIDYSAPGTEIPILTLDHEKVSESEGTSYATAHLTGLVAHVLQRNQIAQTNEKSTVEQVNNVLKSWSKDLGVTGKDNLFGEGSVSIPKSS
ncbi:S8 family serine peptidase [Bacillus sp. CH30_1T]|uniref:S8 family peptidase n=1 Tax=Bacillus sp. CH30_1T TaxID=2604836 RepID=UPI0011EF5E30|nr:S8 family serine peptidase [Bacillus sp. CH30_1T]KAA0560774.1 S8 family serine peptidase [Bacillus sp. CH30_1T]